MSDATNARDEALQRVEEHADPDWLYLARVATVRCLRNLDVFSADDVWDQLDAMRVPRPHEPRALAPVLLALKRERLIIPTEMFTVSKRTSRHAGPVRVWRSNVQQGRLF